MDVFCFDEMYFFHRQPHHDCWYAYLHPSLNRVESDDFAHGYFSVVDGKFVQTPEDGRCFTSEQVAEIERLLTAHAQDMKLEQFDVHTELPAHYRELNSKSNCFADLQLRCRATGVYDPDFSVALNQMTNEWPAYRLTREFVLSVLARTKSVSAEDRQEWLQEVLEDSWTYDVSPEPGESFDTFFEKATRGLLSPHPAERRDDTRYRIFEIEQLPGLYLFAEETDVPGDNRKTGYSCHYLDRESAVVPVPLPTHSGGAYYIA